MRGLTIKVFKKFSLVFIILIAVSYCSGCIMPKRTEPLRNEEREVGDFIVWFYDDYCEIKGTTEQGNHKRFLVVPEFIDGVKVKSLGYNSILGAMDIYSPDAITHPDIESELLEKIYFESAIEVYPFLENNLLRPNLKKIMYPVVEEGRGIYGNVYYPRSVYENAVRTGDSMYIDCKYPANVSYYYNYENKDDNYYFIDDCNYGGTIEFIPNDPVREGFSFGGWYKEKECLNKWDFETDTLPKEKVEQKEIVQNGENILVEVPIYQETILYAQWIKLTEY